MAKAEFTQAAIGIPDLKDGSWHIQDLSGKGFLPSIQAATAPQQDIAPDAGAKPQKLGL